MTLLKCQCYFAGHRNSVVGEKVAAMKFMSVSVKGIYLYYIYSETFIR